MSMIKFTAEDYCTYLKMSNRTHVLMPSRRERAVFESAPELLFTTNRDADFDTVEDLVCFKEPLSQYDKISQLYDCAIYAEISNKLVVVDDLSFFLLNNKEERSNPSVEVVDEVLPSVEARLSRLTTDGVLIPNTEEVTNYLLQHPDTVDAVSSIMDIVLEEFRNDAQLSLEVYDDPEDEDKYLSIYVRQEHYDEKIVERLDIVRPLFYEHLTGKSGWIIVTTDFDSPR